MAIQMDHLLAAKGCRVVLVRDSAAAQALEEAILQRVPDFLTAIHGVFHSRKKLGPFTVKNKDVVWKILSKAPKAKAQESAYLLQQMEEMDIRFIGERRPATLSHAQLERCSVLYEALCGKRHFLFKDGNADGSGKDLHRHYMTVAKWMKGYDGFAQSGFDFIWITKMKKEDLTDLMSEKEINLTPFSFFEMKGDEVALQDRKAFLSSALSYIPQLEGFMEEKNTAKMTAEQKYREGKSHNGFSDYGTADGAKDEKKAFQWYAAAAVEGHWKAMALLGQMYFRGFGSGECLEERGLYWTAKAAFHPKANDGDLDKEGERILRLATDTLIAYYREKPESRDVLLRYGGEAAEEIMQLADLLRDQGHIKPVIDRNTFKET